MAHATIHSSPPTDSAAEMEWLVSKLTVTLRFNWMEVIVSFAVVSKLLNLQNLSSPFSRLLFFRVWQVELCSAFYSGSLESLKYTFKPWNCCAIFTKDRLCSQTAALHRHWNILTEMKSLNADDLERSIRRLCLTTSWCKQCSSKALFKMIRYLETHFSYWLYTVNLKIYIV